MVIDYRTQGVCSQRMLIDVEDGVVRSLQVLGGCDGNLQGISRLVAGMKVEEVIDRLSGIRCGGKPTSCPDQLGPGAPAGCGAGTVTLQKAHPSGGAPRACRRNSTHFSKMQAFLRGDQTFSRAHFVRTLQSLSGEKSEAHVLGFF